MPATYLTKTDLYLLEVSTVEHFNLSLTYFWNKPFFVKQAGQHHSYLLFTDHMIVKNNFCLLTRVKHGTVKNRILV